MKIYISGPMSGLPGSNFAAFDAERDRLLALGHEVVSPADLSRRDGHDGTSPLTKDQYREALRTDLLALMDGTVDAIMPLPGWRYSPGSEAELAVAHALGLKGLPLSFNERASPDDVFGQSSILSALEESRKD